jgi:hypothetical protein
LRAQHALIEHERRVELRAIGIAERRRHHANDLVCLPVQLDRPAHERRITPRELMPERVSEHRDPPRAFARVVGVVESAGDRTYTERREELAHRLRDNHAPRFTKARQIAARRLKSRAGAEKITPLHEVRRLAGRDGALE